MTKNQLRDVTRIKRLAEEILGDAKAGVGSTLYQPDKAKLEEIATIAKAIDARSGRRDPSVRKEAKRKRAPK